ncbi:hypothetical protein ACIBHX_02280 [Nonomuraea sp. NPDC050536]|uniref:hypothetical protein n=1 Tax=Nonomuraea sp. NPDC050536 TaxID=3364366 RepID=UPI0037C58F69
MKRYAGRRAKPKLSRWCASRGGYGWVTTTDSRKWKRIYISGHAECRFQRWHDPDHLECCAGAEEMESHACQCTCHQDQ